MINGLMAQEHFFTKPPTFSEKYQYVANRPQYSNVCGAMDIYQYSKCAYDGQISRWDCKFLFTWYFTNMHDAHQQLSIAKNLFGDVFAHCIQWDSRCPIACEFETYELYI